MNGESPSLIRTPKQKFLNLLWSSLSTLKNDNQSKDKIVTSEQHFKLKYVLSVTNCQFCHSLFLYFPFFLILKNCHNPNHQSCTRIIHSKMLFKPKRYKNQNCCISQVPLKRNTALIQLNFYLILFSLG